MRDLSVIIPARQEEWLGRTIADVLAHAEADTEVIAVLDGAWADPPIPDHPRVTLIHTGEAIGQRAAVNLAARVSQARHVMKLDAHCSVGQGFDRVLLEAAATLGEDVTQIPEQWNFHVYDQVCAPCGFRADQAPQLPACPTCGGPLGKDVIWERRPRRATWSWVFSPEPKFGYDKAGQHRTRHETIADTMSALGACFFMTRDRFWALGGLDESHGSWGSFGLEIACKSWLSGGRHVVNRGTWFAHFFRVGGIGFPYPQNGAAQLAAVQRAKDLWWHNAWPGQVRPLAWLVDQFWPVPGWTDADRAEVQAAAEQWQARR